MTKETLIKAITSISLGFLVMLFWWLWYPQAMSYQEQNQLFLWTGDYFLQSIVLYGGLGQWLGEFLVQFYRIEWFGAFIIGIVYALITWFLSTLMSVKASVWAVIPSLVLLWYFGNEDVMMAYPVGVTISLASYVCLRKTNQLIDFLILPLLLWAIGPIAWLYFALRSLILNGKDVDKKHWIISLIHLIYLVGTQIAIRYIFLQQWSLESALYGIWYHRQPTDASLWQIVLPIVIAISIIKSSVWFDRISMKVSMIASTVVVAVVGWIAVAMGYDKDVYELINQDYLIRNERWDDILTRAEKRTVSTPFWSESVNLALGMTGKLPDSQFSYFQSGTDALIMGMVRDNTSNLPSMESFYRLGMANECMRYAFDMQESIPNGKKSGRLTQRIVECCLVTGKYEVAKKHIDLLKKSLFYSSWAQDAETYLYNEAKIDAHPVWGQMRRNAFKKDFLYYYPELAKVLYDLFLSNYDNKLALEYMMAQLMLDGNAHVFMQMLPFAEQYGGYPNMPYAYQEAYNCMQGAEAPVGAYGEYARRMMEQY